MMSWVYDPIVDAATRGSKVTRKSNHLDIHYASPYRWKNSIVCTLYKGKFVGNFSIFLFAIYIVAKSINCFICRVRMTGFKDTLILYHTFLLIE